MSISRYIVVAAVKFFRACPVCWWGDRACSRLGNNWRLVGGFQIAMLAIGIDRADQFRQGNVSSAIDFLRSLPECIFETNTRFVASGHDRTLGDERFHDHTLPA